MVFLEFVSFDGDEAVYKYWPDSMDSNPGILSVKNSTGERCLIEKSSDEKNMMFSCHAWKKISSMLDSGELEETACVAWY